MKKADNFNPAKWLVENKITFQSKLNENEEDEQVMINGKEVDLSSIEIDGVDENDYPDFADVYISYAKYIDGTPLTDKELDEFSDKHFDMAYEIALENYSF